VTWRDVGYLGLEDILQFLAVDHAEAGVGLHRSLFSVLEPPEDYALERSLVQPGKVCREVENEWREGEAQAEDQHIPRELVSIQTLRLIH
jgi:hypothetical protein